jgi:hypothetical protein
VHAVNAVEALTELDSMPIKGSDDRGGNEYYDPEDNHIRADEILLLFLESHDPACADIAAAFRRLKERAKFWYA